MQTIKRRNLLTKPIAVLLAMLMLMSVGMTAFATIDQGGQHEPVVALDLTTEQLDAFESVMASAQITGLVDFEDEFALPDDDTQVPVIVFLEGNPAPTQVIEAAVEGRSLSLNAADQNVEAEHRAFRQELSELFSSVIVPFGTDAQSQAAYQITTDFRHTINGVAMTLPANMVEAVSQLSTVQAIFPDYVLGAVEIIEYEVDENGFADITPAMVAANAALGRGGDNPWGMLQGRARMNADEVHAMGYRGEGIIVSVIDTGIDWMHPAFAGSFPPAEVINEARVARFGPNGTAGHRPGLYEPLTQNELFDINRYDTGPIGVLGTRRDGGENPEYVFLGRDNMRLWPGGQGDDPRGNPIQRGGEPGNWTYPVPLPPGMPGNNPSECSPLYIFNDAGVNMRIALGLVEAGPTPGIIAPSMHGTHVAGTILGRPYPAMDHPDFDAGRAIMGVAPGAWGIHYRGLYGHGATYASVWISAQEWSFLDGAHVVNMSLGQQRAGALSLANLSINNLMLADPTIVFVQSAGNSGAGGFYTGGTPGIGSLSISVAMHTEPVRGFTMNTPLVNDSFTFAFNVHRDNARLIQLENGNRVFGPAEHENGVMTVFPMPLITDTAWAGTGANPPSAAPPVGAGSDADFAALAELHGEDLEGNFVLVRRGAPFAAISNSAAELGIAGIITINTAHQNPNNVNPTGVNDEPVPIMQIPHAAGLPWANAILAGDDGYSTFRIYGNPVMLGYNIANLNARASGLPVVAAGSSRGPVEHTHRIGPDIGAHGQQVFSAQPRFMASSGGAAGNWDSWTNVPWQNAHTNIGGTSMSSPHVAGAVALMQHFSRENGGMWANYEIKTRIMNTSIQMQYEGNIYGPMDGATNINVLAAIQTDTVAFAEYDYIPTSVFIPLDAPEQEFATTYAGSISFGGFNRHPDALPSARSIGNGEGQATVRVYLENNSNTATVYSITHRFVQPGLRPARPADTNTAVLAGATLVHPTSVPVPPNSRVPFDVTINIPANNELGFHYGFMTIAGGSHPLTLPFAAVTHQLRPAFNFRGLYRPVISTNLDALQNMTSSELIMYFSQTWGFYADFYLIDAAARESGMTDTNWFTGAIGLDGDHIPLFEDYILGTTMYTAGDYRGRWGRHFPRNRGIDENHINRGVIFDGYYHPLMWETPEGRGERTRLDREGDFYIGVAVWRQSSVARAPGQTIVQCQFWYFDQAVLIPFTVDNTPPEFTALNVNGVGLALDDDIIAEVPRQDIQSTITGNVTDLWLVNAIENEVTFDVFTDANLAAVSKAENLALWAQFGENEAVRATIAENGDFELVLPINESGELTLWLVDGFAPVPVVNQVPIGVGNPFSTAGVTTVNAYWNQPAAARTLQEISPNFVPGGFVSVGADLTDNLRSDVVFGRAGNNNPIVFNMPAENFNQFALAGLNVTELTIEMQQTARGDLIALTAFAATLDRTEGGFTAVTWTRFASANIAANAVLNNPTATQAQIEAAVRNLTNTLGALNPPVQLP